MADYTAAQRVALAVMPAGRGRRTISQPCLPTFLSRRGTAGAGRTPAFWEASPAIGDSRSRSWDIGKGETGLKI